MKATAVRPSLMWLVVVLLVTIAGNSAAHEDGAINTYEGYVLLETNPLSDSQAHALAEAGATWDFWEGPRGYARALVFASPEEAPSVERAFETLGVQYKRKSWTPPCRNPSSVRDRRALRAVSFTRFHRLNDIHEYLDDLAKQYPELVSVYSIGSSLEGRDLKVIRISNDSGRRFKPAAFIDAAIHAREWITPPVALYTILQLVENYNDNKELVDQLDWYILPVLNPDGYEYTFTNERFWRKTRSYNGKRRCFGVDINRNFPIHWREGDASADPCSLTFSGAEAFSEPETRALARFLQKLGPRLRLYLTLHSYGQLLSFPWGFTSELPLDAEEMQEVASAAAFALESVRGTRYTIGNAYNTLYENSGTSRDWVKRKIGVKYVYSMELPRGGSGFDPPQEDILPVVTETFEAIKVLGKAAAGIPVVWHSSRQSGVHGPLLVRDKKLAILERIWRLFVVLIFVVLFIYILIRIHVKG